MPVEEIVPTWIAALPMYDFPDLREAHDRLWAALAQRLWAIRVAGVPGTLTRELSHRAVWAHPRLLLGQACEYPLSKSFRESLRIVATPRYGAPGCAGTYYRSAIVVRADEPVDSLEGLRDRRCVVSEPDSNSGMNMFRAALAPVSGGSRFFQSVCFSGSHRKSLEFVAARDADVTAIDCVTLAHLRRIQPQLTSGVRVIDWTPASPSLPFVTSRQTSEPTLRALRAAMAEIFAHSALAPVREQLFLEGLDLAPDRSFGRVLQLEIEAEQWRYPKLL